MECPRPIKSVLCRFYPTWSSRTRPSKVRGPGVEANLESCCNMGLNYVHSQSTLIHCNGVYLGYRDVRFVSIVA